MKFEINNKIYYKSNYKDIDIESCNENISSFIINQLKNKENRVLIVDEHLNKITLFQFIELIKKVAKGFNLLNLNKGDLVGILLPNILEYTYSVLGVFLSGGIVSQINPNSTIYEIKNTLSTLSPKYIIIDYLNYIRIKDSIKDLFSNCEKIIIISSSSSPLDIIQNEIIINFNKLLLNDGNYNIENSIINHLNKDIALILFSSGTSGNYKGVCLTHENLISNIHQIILAEYSLHKQNHKILSILPMYHVFGFIYPFLSCITFGQTLYFINKFNINKLLTIIQNEKISFLFLVPTIAILLSKEEKIDQYDCKSLHTIVSGGAPLPIDIINLIKNKIKNENLMIRQAYGMSECLAGIVTHPNNFKNGSCGFLLSNMILKVVDPDNSNLNLDSNQIGELCIKGPNIMKCYFNNPKANQDAFDNEGFLLTGDIGYIDKDGEIFIVDRKKEIIKTNGFQVSPSEIESLLLLHPKIEEVCVIGVPSIRFGEMAKAYIVLKENESLSINEIHQWLNQRVSSYKSLHGGIIITDKLPKSSSGKILKRILKLNSNT